MPQSTTPADPDPRFLEFIEKSDAIAGEKLAAAIPREYMQPSVARGFAGLAVSWSLYIGAIVGIAVLDRWYLVVPLVVIAGLGGWGLHCIAHDCGHGSFSRNRRLNFAIGHLALLPLLYPFHSWRHVHNLHHAHTNSLELDTDWRPIPEAVYRRMTLRDRIIYVSTRTWAVWAGTINYWAQSGFRPSYYPKKEMRRDVRRSIWFVVAAGGVYLPILTYFTGWQGLLLYFVAPWFATHTWFSFTTLMHHSSEDIPYLPEQYWTRNASRLNRPRFYAHFLCWKDGAMSIRYDENTKARAVRLVREHRDDYDSEWAAMKAVSGRLGMNPETLRKWVRQAEIDAGEAPGVSSEERRELRELRRKCRELESTIEILKAATSFFARECDPRHR